MTSTIKENLSQVTFKVDAELATRLDVEANDREISRHTCARQLVLEALSRRKEPLPPQDDLMQAIAELSSELTNGLASFQANANSPKQDDATAQIELVLLVDQTREEVRQLRVDLATAICGVLVQLGVEAEEAKRWITKVIPL